MGKILIPGSSGGGVSSDDVTASKAQVLQGYKTVTTDSDDEVVEGTIPKRGNSVTASGFENKPTESKAIARIDEGFYSQNGSNRPSISIPYAVLASSLGVDASKMLSTFTVAGTRGTIPVRGYKGPDSPEFSYYPPEGGYLARVEEGYYHKGGGYKPYVIVPTAKVKQAVNYHPEKTLLDTNTCGEQGQIPIWSATHGDVVLANASHSGQGFAYDLPGVGRGLAVGVKQGAYVNGANYVFFPLQNLQHWNIRKDVNMGGIVGTMVDYGAGGQAFRAATFDGRLLTGVANKGFILNSIGRYLNLKNINYGYQGIVDGGLKFINGYSGNTHVKTAPDIGCVFANSVNLTPFRYIKMGFKFIEFRGDGTGAQPARISLEAGVTPIGNAGGESYNSESNTVLRDIGQRLKSVSHVMTSTRTNAGDISDKSQQFMTLDVTDCTGHHFMYFMLGNIVHEYSQGSVYAVAIVNHIEFIN